jgi:membrane-associated protease RseP (regulator of RpoE activity)
MPRSARIAGVSVTSSISRSTCTFGALTSGRSAIRAERGVRSPRGALIYRASERVTAELGMSPGDVIVQINRTPITSAEDVTRALDYYAERGTIRVFFEHEGNIFPTDFFIR